VLHNLSHGVVARQVLIDVCVGKKRSVGNRIGDDARTMSSRRNAGVRAISDCLDFRDGLSRDRRERTRHDLSICHRPSTCTRGALRRTREPHASSGVMLSWSPMLDGLTTVLRCGNVAAMDMLVGTVLKCSHVTADRHRRRTVHGRVIDAVVVGRPSIGCPWAMTRTNAVTP
jgi:hypothetical protein